MSERRKSAEAPSWRDYIFAVRYIPPFLRLVWQTHRGYTATMIALRGLRAFVPVAALFVGKLIVDTVVEAQGARPDFTHLWRIVALELGIVLAGEALARVSSLVESLLGELFYNHISIRLMEHAATLDLFHFEDPAFYDKLERARRWTMSRIALLTELLSRSQDALTVLSLGAVLAVTSPWLLVLLIVAVWPSIVGESHFAAKEYVLLHRWASGRRQLDYLRYVGASDSTAKEVHSFGLSPWLIERYRALSAEFYGEMKALAVRRTTVTAVLSAIGTLGYYGAYVVVLWRAMTGAITLGSLTFIAGAFARSRDILQRLLLGMTELLERCLYLQDLFDFFDVKPTLTSPPGAPKVPSPIRSGFVFEDVGFRYPRAEQWAVRHVSFALEPGERLALVGENGSGKTTLSKLLARLYDPTEGRILLDGVDLREYDVASLRRSIGFIFQDFVRYDMRFDENIGAGGIDEVWSYLTTPGEVPEPIVRAAERSLAASFLPRLAGGYRQMLGYRFDGGVNLSGGEWQKVALARAYMRRAQVLLLDEPTASLDARAEHEVSTRFAELAAGRMAVIISHRFSTVRMAERILVMREGTVVDEGTHGELVARDGIYAELFAMQAEQYR